MWKIANAFNSFQSQFTYRQRFIFFGCVLLLVAPLPAYWVFATQNFLIQKVEQEMLASRVQMAANVLLNKVLRYQVVIASPTGLSDKHAELRKLEKTIASHFEEIKTLDEDIRQAVAIHLGEGYSYLEPKIFKIHSLQQIWGEILASQVAHQEQKILDLSHKLVEEINLQIAVAASHILPLANRHLYKEIEILLKVFPTLEIFIVNQATNENRTERLSFLNDQVLSLETNLDHFLNDLSKHADYNEHYFQTRELLIDFKHSLNNLLLHFGQPVATKDSFQGMHTLLEVLTKVNLLNKNFLESILFLQSEQKSGLELQKWEISLLLILVAIFVMICIAIRFITRHLVALKQQIQELGVGDFSMRTFYTFKDEFSLVGQAFNRLSATLVQIGGKLNELDRLLTTSVSLLATTVTSQEIILHNHENMIKECEVTAKRIGQTAGQLAQSMDEMIQAEAQAQLLQEANTGLDRMNAQMGDLTCNSFNIVSALHTIDRHMGEIGKLIFFMNKLSDHANLLFLNAAIETVHTKEHETSFRKVTQEIQLFASSTAEAAKEIKNIIKDVSGNIDVAQKDINRCVVDIGTGVSRLRKVRFHLSNMAHQIEKQGVKYHNVNDIMHQQARDANLISDLMDKLSKASNESTSAFLHIHREIDRLSDMTRQLNNVLDLFKKRNPCDG